MKRIALHRIVDTDEFLLVSLLVASFFANRIVRNIKPKRKR